MQHFRSHGAAPTAGHKRELLALRLTLIYLLATAALGAASRGDELVLALLRPLAIALGAAAIWLWPARSLTRVWPLVAFIGSVALLCIVQLIPLPPDLWSALPGRDVVADLDRIVFSDLPWRAATLSPRGTFNTLFYALSLIGGLLLLGPALAAKEREAVLLRVVLGIAVVSVLLALFQSRGGQALYQPYRLMAPGPSGLFSNSNHFGMFSAIGILIAVRLASMGKLAGAQAAQWMICALIAVVMLAGALVSASRLAFGASGIALLCATLVFLRNVVWQNGKAGRTLTKKERQRRRLIGLGLIVASLVLTALFVWIALIRREVSMGNFEEVAIADSIRVHLAPILAKLVSEHWLVGIGFGSFADYYAIIEPAERLGPQYVNQAHNDFAQIVIEGGILAGFIMLSAIVWLGRRLLGLIRAGCTNRAILVTGLFAITAMGSLLDYVLRTPLFAYVVLMLVTLWLTNEDGDARTSKRAGRQGSLQQ